MVDNALELGVNVYATADFYGTTPGESERVLGRCLGARRQQA